MLETLEAYMDQLNGSKQAPTTPMTHQHKAIQRIGSLGYIMQAWAPEVCAKCLLHSDLAVMHVKN